MAHDASGSDLGAGLLMPADESRSNPSGSHTKARAIPSLTGIRGVAAVWVVLFHIGQGAPGTSLAPWLMNNAILRDGFRGVDLFFILSGFIMMHVHMGDFMVFDARMVKRFFLIRFFRIYPANLIVLLFILAAVLTLPDYVRWTRDWNSVFHMQAYTVASFVQTATLSQRWLMPDFGDWNGPAWSLSVEMAAYAIFPFLAWMLSRAKRANVCLLLAIASLVATIVLLRVLGVANGDNVGRLGLLRGFGGFIAGAAIYRYVALNPASARWSGVTAIVSVVLICALAYSPQLSTLTLLPFAGLVAALSFQTGVVDAALRSRPVMFFGKISFSLYLVHLTPLQVSEWLVATGRLGDTPATVASLLAVYAVFVIGLSAALHHWVERPCQRLGRRVVLRMDGGTGQAARRDAVVARGAGVANRR